MHTVLILHGPNLNLLGTREPEVYGHDTLSDIGTNLAKLGKALAVNVESFQSNHEGGLIDRIHAAKKQQIVAIVINPGAFTHTSIALRDALLGVSIPFVEVHLSNVHAREPFRQHSFLSDKAVGVICGLGARGYEFALRAVVEKYVAPLAASTKSKKKK